MLVVGVGKLGSLVVQTLALAGCAVVGVNRSAAGKARLESLGVAVVGPDAVELGGFDVAVEATGNAAGFAVAQKALRPRGTLVLKSTYAGRLELDAAPLVIDEITVVGSRCGPFPPALELLAEGKIDVGSMIEHRFALSEGLAAFAKAAEPGVLKVLLDIG